MYNAQYDVLVYFYVEYVSFLYMNANVRSLRLVTVGLCVGPSLGFERVSLSYCSLRHPGKVVFGPGHSLSN